MVPRVAPAAAAPADPFFAVTGLRYLTIGTADLDGVIARAAANRGQLQHGPIELGGGVRVAVLVDPDGNSIEVVQEAS